MNTAPLKSFAPAVRRQIIEAVTRKLDFVLSAQTPDTLSTFARQVAALRKLAEADRVGLIERVAYTWFNRLAALRYLDAKGWHPFRTRVLTPAAQEETQPELLKLARTAALPEELRRHTDPARLDGLLDGHIPSPDPQGEVYRHLVLAACRFYNALLPNLFERLDDETELLLPDDLLTEHSIVHGFRTEISDADCAEVEILGWLYQFYIAEKKDAVMARKSAVPTADIPAVTQLFTPHWIVRYLVENSLGRLWLLNRPSSQLREQMPYYIEEEVASGQGLVASEEREATTPLATSYSPLATHSNQGLVASKEEASNPPITADSSTSHWPLATSHCSPSHSPLSTSHCLITKPEEIRLIDPACGSGHMLTYAFDLLYAIYEEEGYAPSEIPGLILTHNLYGLDICPRAAQLAALALVLKAREKYRQFFQPGKLVQPKIMALQDVRFDEEELSEYTRALNLGELFNQPVIDLLQQFKEATTFGSLIQPCLDEAGIAFVRQAIELNDLGGQIFLTETHRKVLLVLEQAEMLCKRYHVVVANPPYMGSGAMNGKLKGFIEQHLNPGKSDSYAAFMMRNLELVVQDGIIAMITIPNWMFLSAFVSLRESLLEFTQILSLIQCGRGVWGSDFGSCAFVLRAKPALESPGLFKRLFKRQGEVQSNQDIEANFLNTSAFPNYSATSSDFKRIPGSPIAYWASEGVRSAFSRGVFISDYYFSDGLTKTGNNERYLRKVWEVSGSHIRDFNYYRHCVKGGEARKYYGNLETVVDWTPVARQHYKDDHVARITPEYLWLAEGISWTKVSSAGPTFRRFYPGMIAETGGPAIFANERGTQIVNGTLGFLCSNVCSVIATILNPTLNNQTNDVLRLPIEVDACINASKLVDEAIDLSKNDWDNFETSWEFHDQPLLRQELKGATLGASWQNWEAHSSKAIRRMQELETENNRLFIEAYGLQDELTPEVPEDQITLARADRRKDMAAFLSYAIGCMMGRYSLDQPGLILANAGDMVEIMKDEGGSMKGWKATHAGANETFFILHNSSFIPDQDAIIPILEGEWFEDDIVTRTREFLRATFGEATLRDNIRFIEESLGKELRKYYLTDFYKDHLQTYKKRPIYWLVQSPKKGFSVLIYLHRYTKDTMNLVLNRYLRPYQEKLRNRLAHLAQLQTSEAISTRDKTAARKEADKLGKILHECEEWERQTLLPLAQARIELDLDDGVKVNYLKLGEALAPIPGLAGEVASDQ